MSPSSFPPIPQSRREPLAIIGIGCRYPGASDAESFWRVLNEGIETVSDYPGGRLRSLDHLYASAAGIASRRGGFLPELDRFDTEFFDISPREAAVLDPQQRLLLEVGFEALADAGIPTEQVAGSRTGVFVGAWTSDYEACVNTLSPDSGFHATTGTGRYSLSGRLAYALDLRGPNLTVDTACSSSLVAIHLACQSLRAGESEIALAGGVNVILRPEITVAYSSAGMLSPEGKCKFGDASANGYVRSEGAGVIVLKTLTRALADGDSIYALIRGSAVNNDGRSSGFLIAPSREGQEAALRWAFQDADLRAEQIDYIEAHGTGTAIGDPVEIETIGLVMKERSRELPCIIGSCKTNIGHTESAAGIAGVVKVALSLKRQIIPPTLNFRNPNPSIAWDRLPIQIRTAGSLWPARDGSRFAGVSGFGITGANAHIVLESAPHREVECESRPETPELFLLSARTQEALNGVKASWRQRLTANDSWPDSLRDLAYTAAVRRTHFECRSSLVVWNGEELIEGLSDPPALDDHADAANKGAASAKLTNIQSAKTVFVFPGQGGQWQGMGRTLHEDEPVFRQALHKCDRAIHKHTGWSVIERLVSATVSPGSDEIDVVQPCLFALMVALAALWRSWGVVPDAVVGHSMGECAASVVAGVLSLDDAAAVICKRSRLMKRARGLGLMAVAELGLEDALRFAEQYAGRISLAANNSATSSVFSGDPAAIVQLMQDLENREIFCRQIRVDVASHCAQMESILPDLVAALDGIRPQRGLIPIYSTTSGEIEDGNGLDAAYWGRNLRQPVLFSQAIEKLLKDGCNTFLEINAHPILLQSIETGIHRSGKNAIAVGSLRRDESERAELLESLGSLYRWGYPVDWSALYPGGLCQRLPVYPWQRERHWIDEPDEGPNASRAALFSGQDPNELTYELKWAAIETPATADGTSKTWIIVDSSGSVGSRIAECLRGSGDVAIEVGDPDNLAVTLASMQGVCNGCVHVCSKEDTPFESVRVLQALASCQSVDPPRLWLVTHQAVQVCGVSDRVSPEQAATWGLARVLAWEHPEFRNAIVDLPASAKISDFDSLCRVLRADGLDEEIAVRGGSCFTARYERMRLQDPSPPAFDGDATYLITGGLGGVGLELARWLVENGARYLALVGRRPPSDAANAAIAGMGPGTIARTFAADIADTREAARVLDTVVAEMPPLRGVFHLAAITDSSRLVDSDRQSFERVMRPKVTGAWNLHRLTEARQLDYFVLFSSHAHHPGVGAYAAANATLDALAQYRQAAGLPGLSVQWGVWKGLGMATQANVLRGTEGYQQQGIDPLDPASALAVLGRLMKTSSAGRLIVAANWDQFACRLGPGQIPHRLLNLASGISLRKPESEIDLAGQLGSEPSPARRRALLEAFLKNKLALILKAKESSIGMSRPFGSMGLDSLMGLDFVRRIAAAASVRLPATIVFNYPTIELLAVQLAARMHITLEGPPNEEIQVAHPQASAPGNSIAKLSEDEAIEELLAGDTNR